jgi:hypothetical protein
MHFYFILYCPFPVALTEIILFLLIRSRPARQVTDNEITTLPTTAERQLNCCSLSTPGAHPVGDDAQLALLGQGIAEEISSRAVSARVFANDTEIEQEFFCPLLVSTILSHHRLCTAVEKLVSLWWSSRPTISSSPQRSSSLRLASRKGRRTTRLRRSALPSSATLSNISRRSAWLRRTFEAAAAK